MIDGTERSGERQRCDRDGVKVCVCEPQQHMQWLRLLRQLFLCAEEALCRQDEHRSGLHTKEEDEG